MAGPHDTVHGNRGTRILGSRIILPNVASCCTWAVLSTVIVPKLSEIWYRTDTDTMAEFFLLFTYYEQSVSVETNAQTGYARAETPDGAKHGGGHSFHTSCTIRAQSCFWPPEHKLGFLVTGILRPLLHGDGESCAIAAIPSVELQQVPFSAPPNRLSLLLLRL